MTENESNADASPSGNAKRARSVPPVIDLAAQEIKSDQPSSDQKEPDTVSSSKKLDLRWIGAALAGGLIGGALVAGVFFFIPTKDSAADRLTALEGTVGELRSQEPLNRLDARLAKVESSVTDLRKSLEQTSTSSPELATRLKAVEEALKHMTVQAPLSDGPLSKAALRLTLATLIKDKVKNGLPYGDEYKAFVALVGSSNSSVNLQKFSSSGLLSYEALKIEFLKAFTPIKPDASITPSSPVTWNDRILTMLSRVVKITPAEQKTAGTLTNLTEIETALTNHQGAKAFELWQSLPDHDKQTLAQWASYLRDKLDAETAAEALVTDALHALDMKGISQ